MVVVALKRGWPFIPLSDGSRSEQASRQGQRASTLVVARFALQFFRAGPPPAKHLRAGAAAEDACRSLLLWAALACLARTVQCFGATPPWSGAFRGAEGRQGESS